MGIRQMWMKIPANICFASIMTGIIGIPMALSIWFDPVPFIYGLILAIFLFIFLLALTAFRWVEKYRPSWLQLIILVGVPAGLVTGIVIFHTIPAGGKETTMSLINVLLRLFTFLTFMGILQLAAKGYLSWGKSSSQ